MINLKTIAAVAIGLAVSAAATQAAVQVNGTLGFVPMDDEVIFTGANLGTATSVTLPALEVVNSRPLTYNFTANDFRVGDGRVNANTPVTLSTYTLTFASFPVGGIDGFLKFNVSGASPLSPDYYLFDLDTLTKSHVGLNDLSLQGTGILYDFNGNYVPTPAKLSASFTTTGEGSVNASFTLSTIPVPEPSTYIAGLGALALFGFTAIPKRKVVK